MKSKSIAALVATAGLIWGTAHAAPDVSKASPEDPGVVVLELGPIPGVEPGSAQEQAIMAAVVQQLLEAVQTDQGNVEVEYVPQPAGQRI
jgi:hypothetical protein